MRFFKIPESTLSFNEEGVLFDNNKKYRIQKGVITYKDGDEITADYLRETFWIPEMKKAGILLPYEYQEPEELNEISDAIDQIEDESETEPQNLLTIASKFGMVAKDKLSTQNRVEPAISEPPKSLKLNIPPDAFKLMLHNSANSNGATVPNTLKTIKNYSKKVKKPSRTIYNMIKNGTLVPTVFDGILFIDTTKYPL